MIYKHSGNFYGVTFNDDCARLGMITYLSGKLLTSTCDKPLVVTVFLLPFGDSNNNTEPHMCPAWILTEPLINIKID